MTDASGISLTLVFTDLADSTTLKTQRGDQAVGELITRHRTHVRRLAAESGGRIIDWALGYIYAAMSAAELDHVDEARDLVRQARGVQPDLCLALAYRALVGTAPDVDRCMSAALRKAGLE